MKAWRLPAAKRVGGAGEFVQRQQRFTQLPVQGGVEGRGSLCPGKVQHTPGIASHAVLAVAVLDALAVLHRHPVRIGGGRDVRRGFRDGQRGGPLGKGGVKPCQPRQTCLLIASFRLRVQPVPKAGTQSGDHPEPARQGGKAIPHERGLAGPSGNLHILGALPEHPEGQRQGLIPVCPLEFPFPDPLRKAGSSSRRASLMAAQTGSCGNAGPYGSSPNGCRHDAQSTKSDFALDIINPSL